DLAEPTLPPQLDLGPGAGCAEARERRSAHVGHPRPSVVLGRGCPARAHWLLFRNRAAVGRGRPPTAARRTEGPDRPPRDRRDAAVDRRERRSLWRHREQL